MGVRNYIQYLSEMFNKEDLPDEETTFPLSHNFYVIDSNAIHLFCFSV